MPAKPMRSPLTTYVAFKYATPPRATTPSIVILANCAVCDAPVARVSVSAINNRRIERPKNGHLDLFKHLRVDHVPAVPSRIVPHQS